MTDRGAVKTIEQRAKEIAAAMPPLTDAQRHRIAGLLRQPLVGVVHQRDDGRLGYWDRTGTWHNGSPAPTWGEFLAETATSAGTVADLCALLGVRPNGRTTRRNRKPGQYTPQVEHEPCVYYVALADGDVKVGYAVNVRNRFLAHVKSRGATHIRAIQPGGRDVEQAVLRRFQSSRWSSRSEVLRPSVELDEWIDEQVERAASRLR